MREGLEHRLSKRVAVTIPARLCWSGGSVRCETRNLSEGGVFVVVDPTLPARADLKFEVTLPGTMGSLTIPVEVRWVREGLPGRSAEELPAGCGLRFLSLAPGQREHIRQFVVPRESIGPGDDGPEGSD